jgi:hypothetical protein
MKISYNNPKDIVHFYSLNYGDVFRSEAGYTYIRVDGDLKINSVELEKGLGAHFEDNELVTPLPNARLVID